MIYRETISSPGSVRLIKRFFPSAEGFGKEFRELLAFLFNGTEFRVVPSIPSSAELFFCRKFPTLLLGDKVDSVKYDHSIGKRSTLKKISRKVLAVEIGRICSQIFGLLLSEHRTNVKTGKTGLTKKIFLRHEVSPDLL